MRWLVLELEVPADDEVAGLVVEELVALSGRGVEEREEQREGEGREGEGRRRLLVAYLAPPPGPLDAFVEEVRLRIEAAVGRETLGRVGVEPAQLTHRWQEQEEWAEIWRRGLAPRLVSPRIMVSPTWEEAAVDPGVHVLSLDPGMAFGTAEHPTTRGALRLLDPRLREGDRVADVGAGSGILSIAAALLGARSILAIEMDPWACQIARENAERNGALDRMRIVQAEVGPEGLPGEPPFDLIVANLESVTLRRLLVGLRRSVRVGGWALLGGVLLPEADAMVKAAEESGFSLDEEDREEEWWTGAFRAM